MEEVALMPFIILFYAIYGAVKMFMITISAILLIMIITITIVYVIEFKNRKAEKNEKKQ